MNAGASSPSTHYQVIVGLGNPGPRYDGTRHNIGFAGVDALLQCHGASDRDDVEKRIDGIAARAIRGDFDSSGWTPRGELFEAKVRIGDSELYLLKPRSYMNLSGEPLRAFLTFRKVPLESVIVLHDEIDLPVGSLRVKVGGGEGGHNGLRSIANVCGGRNFARVRMGVGKPLPGAPQYSGEDGIARWVLSRYLSDELPVVAQLLGKAAAAALCLAEDGLQRAQNAFNR